MQNQNYDNVKNAITGCILGTAVADALGLPAEGLKRGRLAKIFPEISGHSLLFGKGLVSDDTDHTCMVAACALKSCGSPDVFDKEFSKYLKRWLLTLPGGIGPATGKACIKLLLGFSPSKSGVFSAGNGPAMKSAILGVLYGNEPEKMLSFVRASTRVTHTDPKAEYGAIAVALAAYFSYSKKCRISPDEYLQKLQALLNSDADEFINLVKDAAESAKSGKTTAEFASVSGRGSGVSAYVYNTVPVVLHEWFLNPADYKSAVINLIKLGGDTDTTAAIAGAIIGSRTGEEGIPNAWIKDLAEWPRTKKWMRELSEKLAKQAVTGDSDQPKPFYFIPSSFRNIFFFILIIIHGLRRLFPPY